MVLLKVCIYLGLIGLAAAHSSGAGQGACSGLSMQPEHGGTSQNSLLPPYTIHVAPLSYSPSQDINVTVYGTEKFKGFLLIASTIGGTTAVGTFSAVSPTLTSFVKEHCSVGNGSGLTHQSAFNSNGQGQNELHTTWRAPATGVGSVQFYLTAVKTQMVYYTKIEGPTLTDATIPVPTNPVVPDVNTPAATPVGASGVDPGVQGDTTPNAATHISPLFSVTCFTVISLFAAVNM